MTCVQLLWRNHVPAFRIVFWPLCYGWKHCSLPLNVLHRLTNVLNGTARKKTFRALPWGFSTARGAGWLNLHEPLARGVLGAESHSSKNHNNRFAVLNRQTQYFIASFWLELCSRRNLCKVIKYKETKKYGFVPIWKHTEYLAFAILKPDQCMSLTR